MLKLFKKDEEGQVLIFVAVLMFVLIGFTALVIDVGYYYVEKRQLQNAVDAAALAGVIVADETNGDSTMVGQEVDKYLSANLDKTADNPIIDIDMNEPITVGVDLTTDYPTFFSRIFEVSTVDIYAHAKAILHKFEFEPTPYAIMAEQETIEFNGNKFKVYGPLYSKEDSNPDFDKVDIFDSDPEQNRSEEDLVHTAAYGEQFIPDYSGLLKLPAKKMTEAEFEDYYFTQGNELSGIVHITGTGKIKLKGPLEGKGVVYSTQELDLTIQSNPGTAILYYSDKDIVASQSTIYGTLYAPKGDAEFNGNPNNSMYGGIFAKNSVVLNGAKFETNLNADDWTEDLPGGGSQLIE